MNDRAPLLEACKISKAFPGVQALSEVSLQLYPGEVLGVVGENGAGKSTLMKILAGVIEPDSGEIRLDGLAAEFKGVSDAQSRGVVLIHQELNLCENLDVASNLFLGREPVGLGPLQLIRRKIYQEAEVITNRIGLNCSGKTRVSELSVGQQQLVEIGRALSLNSRVLIMDEPTSSLTQRETTRLFEVIRQLRNEGVSILYISHRMKELEEITDRVTVLRDGVNAGELPRADITHRKMVQLMVGRELKQFFERTHTPDPTASPRLEVIDFVREGHLPPVSFEIRPGEIVGMAGLMGAGRTELAEALFGVRSHVSGTVRLDGLPLDISSPRQTISQGMFLVPEDRRMEGLVLASSVAGNISLPSLDQLSWLRLVNGKQEQTLVARMIEKLNVRTPSSKQTVGLLSGGNQQKVVLAKWLARDPKVLILDEPTRGIDVGAKHEIYTIMDQLAAAGVAVWMISSDLEEILGMSDRVLVMHEGRLAGQLVGSAATEESIMNLATGGPAA